MKKRFVFLGLLFFLSFLLLFPLVKAEKQNHLLLLAVEETPEGLKGHLADLYLEIKPGKGRVFLETFPLTKIDTQMSTRFAKEIACSYFSLDCQQYDFFYTIKADSSIIGGPSAGASIAVLTAASLLNLSLEKNMALTGTINSGGIIGSVGGLREKIKAAGEKGIKKVLIPEGISNGDLENYGKELKTEVKKVGDLGEALFYFTGTKPNEGNYSFEVDSSYQEIAKGLKETLCEKSLKLKEYLKEDNLTEIEKEWEKVEETTKKGDFYSAASFCFGINVKLKSKIYQKNNLSEEEIKGRFNLLANKLKEFEKKLEERELKTLSDLQTYGAVKIRLEETKELIKRVKEKDLISSLAYAEERFFSALSWANFFEMEGRFFSFDKEILKEACLEKLSETKERWQYLTLLFPTSHVYNFLEQLNKVEGFYQQEDFALCLFKASEVKAEINALLSTINLQEKDLQPLVENKIKTTKTFIAKVSQKEIFPILGYSYYQYALSLKETNPYSALIYSEYALELSNLDIYFPSPLAKEKMIKKEEEKIPFEEKYLFLLLGAVLGLIIGFLFGFLSKKAKRKKRFIKYS